MMRLKEFPYRFADAVLDHSRFGGAKDELVQILSHAPVPLLDPENPNAKSGGVKHRVRPPLQGDSRRRWFFLPVDQKALNVALDNGFDQAGWEMQPPVVKESTVNGAGTKLKADFKKNRIQVEVQFGNMARWYTDVFKFQLSYSRDEIDAAVLVVGTQRFANLIDENVAYFERVIRELPHAKMSLTLPILVIGIEPTSFLGIKRCYEIAARTAARNEAAKGKQIVAIPFADRVAAEPSDNNER